MSPLRHFVEDQLSGLFRAKLDYRFLNLYVREETDGAMHHGTKCIQTINIFEICAKIEIINGNLLPNQN